MRPNRANGQQFHFQILRGVTRSDCSGDRRRHQLLLLATGQHIPRLSCQPTHAAQGASQHEAAVNDAQEIWPPLIATCGHLSRSLLTSYSSAVVTGRRQSTEYLIDVCGAHPRSPADHGQIADHTTCTFRRSEANSRVVCTSVKHVWAAVDVVVKRSLQAVDRQQI